MRAARYEKKRFRAATGLWTQNLLGERSFCLIPGDLVGASLTKDMADFELSETAVRSRPVPQLSYHSARAKITNES